MEIDLAAARKASDGRRQQLATKFEPRAACGDRMVELVERMLELHKRKARCSGDVSSPKSPGEHSSPLQLEREIAATDGEIDELVYELYGITEEERKIIEGAL
jgi:hypothetical protein